MKYHAVLAKKARDAEREGKFGEASEQWRAACRAATTKRQVEDYADHWRRADTQYTKRLLELNNN